MGMGILGTLAYRSVAGPHERGKRQSLRRIMLPLFFSPSGRPEQKEAAHPPQPSFLASGRAPRPFLLTSGLKQLRLEMLDLH